MRSKKILPIALVFSLIVSLSCSSQNKLAQLDKYNWFSFQWYADSVSGRYFDKLALMLPVGISNLKGKFIVQFDLGSNITDLYGNCLKNYFNSRQELLSLLDTSKKLGSGNDVHYRNKELVIKMNNYSIT